MEPSNTTEEKTPTPHVVHTPETSAPAGKKLPLIPLAIGAAALLLIITGLFTKGYLVAAMVDGSPISRLAVVKQLEQQGGEQALQALIDKMLIEKGFKDNGIEIEQSAIDTKIAEIEAQIGSQGGTLEEALAGQGMDMTELRTQIRTQIGLEQLLADKAAVTDEEIDAYITENNIQLPEGVALDDVKAQLGEQLKQQKFATEAQKWIAEITEKADITYYVKY